MLTAEINTPDMDAFLQKVYEAYADYVLKNPFYELEMPIRVERFSDAVQKITQHFSAGKAGRSQFALR